MKTAGLMMVVFLAGISLAVAAGSEVSQVGVAGQAVEKPVVPVISAGTNDLAVVDTNALVSMKAEEKALAAEAKEIARKITVAQKPLRDVRQRVMKEDKELQALSQAIAARQQEFEARLMEKYPDIAAKEKSGKELFAQYSEVDSKLRNVRLKLDAMNAVMRKQAAEKESAK
jgi:chromosome segregation ATPase